MINRGETMQLRMRKIPVFLLLAGLLCGVPRWCGAQKGRATGGTQEIFKLGVGARALGLGSAVVAMPLDASTVYWNPGGLDYLERRSVTMFYTPLMMIADTKYHYIGAAYPVLNFGTFGAGWMHWDIPDVITRDVAGDETGNFVSGEDAFLVSYAKQVRYGVSLGGSVKFRRQQITGNTARGFTGDIGVLYRPEFGEGVLQNLSLGLAVQNVIPLRMRPGNFTETIPYMLRGGLAKALRFGPRQDVVNIFAAFEKGQGAAMKYNFGSEYVYQDLAMLRLGYNGRQPIFGGGVSYQMFQIDYAFGKYADEEGELSAQHRVSITVHFGKTKTQMYEETQERLFRQIEAETIKQAKMNRRTEFEDKVNKGKTYFQQGEYFNAFFNFTQARDLMAGAYDIFEQPEKDDVEVWVERAKTKMDEEAKAERQRLAQTAQETAVAEQTRAFVEEQTRKGMQNLQAGKYSEAIAEWQRGLERDPENAQLKDLIDKTKGQIRDRASEQLRQARILEGQGKVVEAINEYTKLMNQPYVSPAELKAYQERVASLQKQLNNEQLFRQGYGEYLNKNYCSAKQFFSQALEQADRENSTLRQYYYDADSRCNARLGPLPESIRQRFLDASSLIQSEQYDAALKILLEIQKQDRYNKRILDAIDLARERTGRKN
jgi:tetratricopeptide (TPR) repeat protein